MSGPIQQTELVGQRMLFTRVRTDLRGWRFVISISSIAVAFLIWWAITALELVRPLFVPPPADVWNAFTSTLTEGYRGHLLHEHLLISMQRVFLAFALALVLAIPLGLLVGASRRLEAALEPLINFYRVLPPLAYYALLIIWLGIGETPKVMLLLLAGFPPIFIGVVQGMRNVPKERLDAARSLGAGSAKTLRYVVFPSVLPDVFTGIRVSIGFTYTTLVAAEMVAAESGIGWVVLDASRYLQSDVVFMGIIVMGITGVVLDSATKFAQRKVVPWQGKG